MNLRAIATAIIAAINRGSVMYNSGDIAGCADLYILTSVQLLSHPDVAGYPKSVLSSALAAATEGAQTLDQQAWTMRQAFDAILEFAQQSADPATCEAAVGTEEIQDQLIFDGEAACHWGQLHDGVMGGVSSGNFRYDAASRGGDFSGVIRTENNGGFASVRKPVALDGKDWDGIFLDVSSDDAARIYSVNLKDPACVQMGGVNFKSKFTAPSAATPSRVLLPFSSFRPEFRGRQVAVAPLDMGRLVELSFMTTKPPGTFTLRVAKLGFYKK